MQLGGRVQSRMDVALRDWVGRVTPAAKQLGRNHTEPYTWRPYSNVTEVGCAAAVCCVRLEGACKSGAVVAQFAGSVPGRHGPWLLSC